MVRRSYSLGGEALRALNGILLLLRTFAKQSFNSESLMVVWSGLGFLVAVITFGSCLLTNLILDEQFGEGYYSSHLWAVGFALLVGGMISSAVGVALKLGKDRFVVDEETGERLVINRSDHSFFFVPMHWAGLLIAAGGLGLILYDVLT